VKSIIAGLTSGAATALLSRGESLVQWPDRVRMLFPGVVGAVAGSSTVVAALAPRVRPRHLPVILSGVAIAGGAGWFIGRKKLQELQADGAELDATLVDPPLSQYVSGGPGSTVDYSLLSREGARFVHSTTSLNQSTSFVSVPRTHEPIRIFVSVQHESSIPNRIAVAIEELNRTGAFERKYLLVQSPAGSGYANSTPVDVLEFLSGGDCATVVVSYGLLPSFLSLTKVSFAGDTQRALLEALVAELESRSRRGESVPELFVYGESLGAKVQQYALPLGPVDLNRFHISRALWVGTPGGTSADGFHLLCAGESITIDRPEQIPPGADARVWFLEHDGDPVVRFRPDLTWSQPQWLVQQPRGRNIPESMSWKPGLTWATVLVDTIFATNVKPGDFQSWGHDYRADLGEVAARAFGFQPEPEVMNELQAALRECEVARAQRVLPPA
jgi:uncharacterized membrane protein